MTTMKPQKKTYRNRKLFDYLNNILCGKNAKLCLKHVAEEGFDVDFKKVVLLKYLSMSPDPNVRDIIFENQLAFDRMDCKTLYKYLLKTVPRQKNSFIKFLR